MINSIEEKSKFEYIPENEDLPDALIVEILQQDVQNEIVLGKALVIYFSVAYIQKN